MNLSRKILPLLLAAVLFFGNSPSVQAAEADLIAAEVHTQSAALPDHSVLYDEYLRQLFFPDSAISFLGETARNQLTPLGQKLYDFLKANIQKVASGDNSSTVFSLSSSQLAEWGATTNFFTSS